MDSAESHERRRMSEDLVSIYTGASPGTAQGGCVRVVRKKDRASQGVSKPGHHPGCARHEIIYLACTSA